MSRYTPHTVESAPEASRAGLDKAARKFGRLSAVPGNDSAQAPG